MQFHILRQRKSLFCCALTILACTASQNLFADSITFAGKAIAGSSSLIINGDSGYTVTVYQFDAGYTPSQASDTCSATDIPNGMLVMTTTGSGSSTTSTTTTKLNTAGPQTLSLATPLVAGAQLCLVEVSAAASPVTTYSKFQTVANPLDFGRFQLGFTGGVMISNEQQASSSSTASEYLDLGMAFAWARAACHRPGLSTFLNARLTSLPVSTTNTTATSSTAGSVPTLSQSLNVLSSQQSARILIGAYVPFRSTTFFNKNNSFTIAPLVKAGFDTLLNPSVGTSTTATATPTTTTPISSTSADFSSVYYLYAAGARIGWETFPKSTDEAPISNTWLSFTFGNYSNLPSYVCTSGKYYNSPVKPNTACKTEAVTANGTTTYNIYTSRKLVPRIEIVGEAKIPNYPFVLGLDANLSQYASRFGSNSIDTLNKAGNDVRLYIGYKLDLASAFKKLGVQ